MKKLLLTIGMLVFATLGCSQKEASQQLAKGTPAYDLAKELATTLDYLDPDKNAVLVSTKGFDISAGDVCQTIQKNYGNRTARVMSLPANQLEQLTQRTAESLAERKLLLAAARQAKTAVAQTVVDSVLNLQFSRAGGEQQFRDMLEENKVDFAGVKEDIRTGLSIERYLDAATSASLVVTEEEIQQAYQKDKTASVRHILLTTQGKSDSAKQEIRGKMEDLLARAKAGEDFAELARTHTDDPGSKSTGGLYSDFGRGKMVPPFDEAAFSVPIGEISDIVETAYGYHILKIVDRKGETRPLEEIRPELEAQFKSEKRGKAVREHIEKLKANARFKKLWSN